MIIATAGHIDHGKTSLIKALTHIDTDRLPEEKKRGISIEAGFAHLALNETSSLDFVDVPGHEKFIHHMLSGAYACDHVLLLVAADDGVMPQTQEHISILSLLNPRAATLVLTKIDRASLERAQEVTLQAMSLLERWGFTGTPCFAVSSLTGEGIDALKSHLMDLGNSFKPQLALSFKPPRLLADRVFTLAGTGTVITGTLMAGTLSVGQELVVMPQKIATKIRQLHRHHTRVTQVLSGERCALNLTQIERSQIERGNWLVDPSLARASSVMTLEIEFFNQTSRSLKNGLTVHWHHGASDELGKIFQSQPSQIENGAKALVQLKLNAAHFAVHADRFIVRDNSAKITLGGGRVIDPLAQIKRKKAEKESIQRALALATPRDCLLALLNDLPFGVNLDWFASVFALRTEEIHALLPKDTWCASGYKPSLESSSGESLFKSALNGLGQENETADSKNEAPISFKGHFLQAGLAISAHWMQIHAQKLQDMLQQFHLQHPTWEGMNRSTLLSQFKAPWTPSERQTLLQYWALDLGLTLQGNKVRLKTHQVVVPPLDAKIWQEVRQALITARPFIPSVRELSVSLNRSIHLLRDFLNRYAQKEDLIKVSPERFALPSLVLEFAQHAQTLAASQDQGRFNAAQFRDVSGVGRTLAIEILECLDRLRVTIRQGNERRFLGYEKIHLLRSES